MFHPRLLATFGHVTCHSVGCAGRSSGALDWQSAGANGRSACHGDDKVGLSGSYCAIAETGTDAGQNARHDQLASRRAYRDRQTSRIVRSMEDAFDLERKEHGRLPRQVAFVSGPSRTADIEMTLVLGIHGPYRVHIILVGG
jgi:L-lactate dehydrogenase complex protein LldG